MTDPACPLCGGTGRVPVEGTLVPAVRLCQCALRTALVANADRGMKELSKAGKVSVSALQNHTETNLRVTASWDMFRAHLRHVVLRQSPSWGFQVVSDADLITAWLASVVIEGKDILDPDAAPVSGQKATLVDLILPPTLLIIRLGVKVARNVAMSEVLLEALLHRQQEALPTWLWDQPDYQLTENHICYSSDLMKYLSDWPRLRESDLERPPDQGNRGKKPRKSSSSAGPTPVRASGLFGGGSK